MGVILIIGLVNNFLLIPTFIVAIIFYRLRGFYLPTSRSLKRLEGVTRSPVLGHFNSTMQGLTTIRASHAEQVLTKEFDEYQDKHSSTWYSYISSSGAFGMWLDAVCWVYISIILLSFIVFKNDEYGGNVGLVITQTFGLAGMVQYGIRLTAEIENQMTAVERVLEYTKCPQEAALPSSSNKKPPEGWPNFGKIVFQDFNLRYSPDEPLILKNINIVIQPMEKVGVVGRTGAGKSSLIEALFRLAHNEGNIVIDDVEIHGLELQRLRSSFSIIPQQPVLFSGTLRNNLDPSDEQPDHVLWTALDEVELKDSIENLPDGLNTNVSESGSNFSVGQKQLICLARAVVRQNKILVLDEATANVDPQTDTVIQKTIRSKFRSCTVITIAHRLNTIIDSDKVLVMDAGVVVEYDHPYNLLENKLGHFHRMVEQTGQISADVLYNAASDSFKFKEESANTRDDPDDA